jgi:hypothetical protein
VLKVLEDKAEIDRAQTLFLRKLTVASDKSESINIGHQGKNQLLIADWSSNLAIWWATKNLTNRYWNAFGTGEPKWKTKDSHKITIEINPPHEGINRHITGVFVKDSNDGLFLFHRGTLGGGKIGIGKRLFFKEFIGKQEEVQDGSKITNLAWIASFDDSIFVEQVAFFVHEVERIKANYQVCKPLS